MPDFSQFEYIRIAVTLATSIVSTTASGINLFLIIDMKIWTGHNQLIALMSLYQILYDASEYTCITSSDNTTPSYLAALAINVLGGTTASVISNVMIGTVFYIVKYRETIDLKKYIHKTHILCALPGLFVALFYLSASGIGDLSLVIKSLYTYVYIRLLSIIFNIIPYIYMSYLIQRSSSRNIQGRRSQSPQEKAIEVLVDRLKYYPLIQALARIGPTWYEVNKSNCNGICNSCSSC